MRQGTTPTHTFEIPLAKSLISAVKVIYAQGDKTVLCKRASDCDIEDGKISTRLTQEETFLFDCKKLVQIQLRVLTTGNDSLVSDIMRRSVAECLDGEVIACD